jgi:hypothetical protein
MPAATAVVAMTVAAATVAILAGAATAARPADHRVAATQKGRVFPALLYPISDF